jgi:NAD(P)H-dependent FMN reductase
MRPHLQIIVGSTRPGRIGLPIARWVQERGTAHQGFEVELVDLAEVGLPLLDEPSHPRLGQYVNDHTKAWSHRVARADAFVLVTPEYNHGYPAPLKNALDYLYREWNHKPVGFVSYGGVAAGTRAVGLLKPVVLALQMVPVVQTVSIPFAGRHVAEGAFTAPEGLDAAAGAMFDALLAHATALTPLRTTG